MRGTLWESDEHRGTARAVVLAVLSVLLAPRTSHAAFSFSECSTTSFDGWVPTEIGATEYVKQTKTPLAGANDMVLYNFDTSQSWPIYTNPNVQFLNPVFGFFVTELNYDKLTITGQSTGTWTYSGSINSSTISLVGSADVWDTGAGTSDTAYVTQSWVSDYNNATSQPPNIAQVKPWCKTTQSYTAYNNIYIPTNTRVDGLLISSGDVFYGYVYQPAYQMMVIRMDALAVSSGSDFDLYVSTSNATPDDSSYDWRGYTSNASEALSIAAPAPYGRYLYVGVHAYGGSGQFTLSADLPIDASVTGTNKVCVTDSTQYNRVTLNSTQLTELRAFLRAGAANLYSFSNGIAWRNSFHLNTSWTGKCDQTNTGCDICVITDTINTSRGGPGTNPMLGYVEMHGGNWTLGASIGWLFAHESGHSCLGLIDQYDNTNPLGDSSPRWCGHTTMANNSKALGYCSRDHCFDGSTSGGTSCSNHGSDWSIILSNSAWKAHYLGQSWTGSTAYPTPSWNNPSLVNLPTFDF